ncbi:hypothetical protein GCM10010171_56190 [Actinokineospora fastidiosa]|uniref:DNA (cytosine-5-)-methyltransferase n=1 Tax=Actinokineospora fastidiosa TaxID=1816 RepID=A0A918LJ22_9PSEU|nr:hypothetical protein GCM10010171_56190 [Actinokineospora fastidiosa]
MTTRPPRERTRHSLPRDDSVTEASPVLGSLCTGYGGLDLGVLTALRGGRIAWVADPDPHIRLILDARMPDIPNLGDLRRIDWAAVEPVDVLVAGFPCQDISAAGKRAGIEKGARSGLWADIVAGLRLLRPALVVLENAAALRWKAGGLHRVLGDLAEAGYDALWRSVRAADLGAPHRRERVFLLAWRRDHDGAADQPPGRRGPRDLVAATPTTPDRCRWQQDGDAAVDRGAAAADPESLGHRDGGPQSRSGVPATAVATGAPPGGTRSAAADPAGDGRDEGLPGTTGLQGRPDAALGGHPPAHPTGAQPGQRQRDRHHLVAVRDGEEGEASQPSAVEATPVNWGVYEAAIRGWETALGRPIPYPIQPGNHGRPVLAPAFVEHLMGLPSGWVTDLPLPRTAQLRALGNGVVPAQAAHAVALLLDDLATVLQTEHRPPVRREVAA